MINTKFRLLFSLNRMRNNVGESLTENVKILGYVLFCKLNGGNMDANFIILFLEVDKHFP